MTKQTHSTNSKRLLEALYSFSHSARFGLFKSVQLGRLMPDGGISSQGITHLANLNFEQLLESVKDGGESLSALSPEQERVLLELLTVLSEEGEATALAPDDDISVVVPDSFTSIDIPTLDEQLKGEAHDLEPHAPSDVPVGSVPLELALRASLAKLVAHHDYDSVKRRTIGEFWDPEWTSAPFEESLTIEQFAGLDLAVLFKKRMVTDTRIQSILRALRRAITLLESHDHRKSPQNELLERSNYTQLGAANVNQSASRDAKSVPRRESPATPLSTHIETPRELPIAAYAVCELLSSRAESHPIAGLLLARFADFEVAEIVLGGEISVNSERKLLKIVERTISSDGIGIIRTLLASPAVRIDNVARIIFGIDSKIDAAAICIAAAVARALGGAPLKPIDPRGFEFWSSDTKGVLELMALETNRRSKGSIQPKLDPDLQEWIRAQGLRSKPGKGRRKGLKKGGHKA